MAHYLVQGSYTPSSIKAMVGSPQDRSNAIRTLIESAGGKFHHVFFSLGECDFHILCELPDNVSAAAMALIVGGSGSTASYRTTVLLTPAEATAAMTKAKSLTYAPPDKAK